MIYATDRQKVAIRNMSISHGEQYDDIDALSISEASERIEKLHILIEAGISRAKSERRVGKSKRHGYRMSQQEDADFATAMDISW